MTRCSRPESTSRRRSRAAAKAIWSLAIALLSPAVALAQADPKFQFETLPEAMAAADAEKNKVEWKAQSKGGLVLTSGNSQTTSVTFGLNASRKQGNNKLALEGGMAYGKSQNLAVSGVDASNQILGVDRHEAVSTNMWTAKGRYDRFLTANNAVYASGQGAADKVAGKSFFGGAQVGYSRQLHKSDRHLVVAELGYDFSHERYVQPAGSTLDPISIHSARAFAGETLKLTPETGAFASVEVLMNLNEEGKAANVSTGEAGVKSFGDTRLLGKIGLSSNLWKKLSLGVSFSIRYDQNPALRPVPAGAPAGAVFAQPYADFAFADKIDTMTEATLIYTFF